VSSEPIGKKSQDTQLWRREARRLVISIIEIISTYQSVCVRANLGGKRVYMGCE